MPQNEKLFQGTEMEEVEVSDSSDSESEDSDDEATRQQLLELEERIGVIPEQRDDKLSKRKVSYVNSIWNQTLKLVKLQCCVA